MEALEILSKARGEDHDDARQSLATLITTCHQTSDQLELRRLCEKGRRSLARASVDGPGGEFLLKTIGKYMYAKKWLWEDEQDRACHSP